MPWWLNWLVLLVGLGLLFVCWSWVPLELLDRHWRWMNPIGRPVIHTLILTGGPALYAKLAATPMVWLLIPITLLLTQYAVLSGRFLAREKLVAGWVMVLTAAAIWTIFWIM